LNLILFLLIRLFRIRPVFLSGFWSPLLQFNNTLFCHIGWSARWLSQTVFVFKLAPNVLRAGDLSPVLRLRQGYGACTLLAVVIHYL